MWREVGSFEGVAQWHSEVYAVDCGGEHVGAERTVRTHAGREWVEQLTAVESDNRCYRYTVTSGDLPVADYLGEFVVREDAPTKSTVVWTAEFMVTASDEKQASDVVREYIAAGARSIQDRYAGTSTTATDDVSTMQHRP